MVLSVMVINTKNVMAHYITLLWRPVYINNVDVFERRCFGVHLMPELYLSPWPISFCLPILSSVRFHIHYLCIEEQMTKCD